MYVLKPHLVTIKDRDQPIESLYLDYNLHSNRLGVICHKWRNKLNEISHDLMNKSQSKRMRASKSC